MGLMRTAAAAVLFVAAVLLSLVQRMTPPGSELRTAYPGSPRPAWSAWSVSASSSPFQQQQQSTASANPTQCGDLDGAVFAGERREAMAVVFGGATNAEAVASAQALYPDTITTTTTHISFAMRLTFRARTYEEAGSPTAPPASVSTSGLARLEFQAEPAVARFACDTVVWRYAPTNASIEVDPSTCAALLRDPILSRDLAREGGRFRFPCRGRGILGAQSLSVKSICSNLPSLAREAAVASSSSSQPVASSSSSSQPTASSSSSSQPRSSDLASPSSYAAYVAARDSLCTWSPPQLAATATVPRTPRRGQHGYVTEPGFVFAKRAKWTHSYYDPAVDDNSGAATIQSTHCHLPPPSPSPSPSPRPGGPGQEIAAGSSSHATDGRDGNGSGGDGSGRGGGRSGTGIFRIGPFSLAAGESVLTSFDWPQSLGGGGRGNGVGAGASSSTLYTGGFFAVVDGVSGRALGRPPIHIHHSNAWRGPMHDRGFLPFDMGVDTHFPGGTGDRQCTQGEGGVGCLYMRMPEGYGLQRHNTNKETRDDCEPCNGATYCGNIKKQATCKAARQDCTWLGDKGPGCPNAPPSRNPNGLKGKGNEAPSEEEGVSMPVLDTIIINEGEEALDGLYLEYAVETVEVDAATRKGKGAAARGGADETMGEDAEGAAGSADSASDDTPLEDNVNKSRGIVGVDALTFSLEQEGEPYGV